jgi:hypothetical protein
VAHLLELVSTFELMFGFCSVRERPSHLATVSDLAQPLFSLIMSHALPFIAGPFHMNMSEIIQFVQMSEIFTIFKMVAVGFLCEMPTVGFLRFGWWNPVNPKALNALKLSNVTRCGIWCDG